MSSANFIIMVKKCSDDFSIHILFIKRPNDCSSLPVYASKKVRMFYQ